MKAAVAGLGIGLVLCLGLGGCLPDTRLRVARLLFDGVPPAAGESPPGTQDPPAAERIPDRPAGSREPAAGAAPSAAPAPLYVHEPYRSGDCRACHDAQGAAGRTAAMLKKPVEALCLDCHVEGEIESLHGAIMECTMCHDPHQSSAEFLLGRMAGAEGETEPAAAEPAEGADQVSGASAAAEPEAGAAQPGAEGDGPPDQVTGASGP